MPRKSTVSDTSVMRMAWSSVTPLGRLRQYMMSRAGIAASWRWPPGTSRSVPKLVRPCARMRWTAARGTGSQSPEPVEAQMFITRWPTRRYITCLPTATTVPMNSSPGRAPLKSPKSAEVEVKIGSADRGLLDFDDCGRRPIGKKQGRGRSRTATLRWPSDGTRPFVVRRALPR